MRNLSKLYIDKTDKYDRQGQFVRRLTEIALRYNVLILLVAHRRKNSFSTDANDEISGSGDITNLAGVTLSYDRGSKEDIEKGLMGKESRKLIVAKNRLFGKLNLEGIVLEYDEKSKRIFSNAEELNRRYGWEKENNGFYESAEGDVVFA